MARITLLRSAIALATSVGLLFASACHAGTPASTPTSAPAPSGSPHLSGVWTALFSQRGPDGSVSTQTALEAFALAIGPLPDVALPSQDPGLIPDGTFAVRWLSAHWSDITPQQRAAASAVLPDLAGLSTIGKGNQSGGPASAAHLGSVPAPRMQATAHRSDAEYTKLVGDEAALISAQFHKPLTLALTANYGTPVKANSEAEAMPLDAKGDHVGPAKKCSITITASGDAMQGDDLNYLLAHEVWHCFEAEYGGLASYDTGPDWVYEGEAEWVAATIHPDALAANEFWEPYLDMGTPLPQRAYDAIGLYAHLTQVGVDVWSRLVPALQPTTAAAFHALGADQDAFLDSWASTYARFNNRGDAWEMVGPGLHDKRYPLADQLTLSDDSVEALQAPAYANQLYLLTTGSDVLLVTATGHARISDGSGHDYLVNGVSTYCHKQDSTCTCPDNTPAVPLLPLAGTLDLGLTGAQTGATGSVTAMSLDRFCRKDLSGTWAGTWTEIQPDSNTGTFNLTWTQTGNALSGTIQVHGTECVNAASVTGTITGNAITFGAVQGGLTAFVYTGTFTKDHMSGTFTGPKCGGATGTWSAHRV